MNDNQLFLKLTLQEILQLNLHIVFSELITEKIVVQLQQYVLYLYLYQSFIYM
jgi:hypothetical protein